MVNLLYASLPQFFQASESGQQVILGFFTRVFIMFTGTALLPQHTHTYSLIKHLLGAWVADDQDPASTLGKWLSHFSL